MTPPNTWPRKILREGVDYTMRAMTTLETAGQAADISGSPRYNADLGPVPLSARTWGTYEIAALWIGMAVCIPTYMLAAGLVAGGMSWWQAVGTITLGNTIVLIPMMLTGHAGTKYGIPFPVLARAAFGLAGSHVPSLLRAGVACGWFGIQTWIGGAAIDTLLGIALPFWNGLPAHVWVSFALFWMMNIYFIVKGTESIRFFEAWAAPVLLLMGVALLVWAISQVGGLGPIFTQPSRFRTNAEFFAFFVPSLT